MSTADLLTDAELLIDGGVTYAALILFGTHRALGRHLAQAEVVFEYRSSEASIPHQQRKEHRAGFFLWFNELWQTIDLRNDVQDFFEGPYRREVRTFNEVVVREAILNAVSHRDYRAPGSVFVRQFPRKLEVVSPGGFPPGVTPENVLYRHLPRNRRVARRVARTMRLGRACRPRDEPDV
jgi:ATP-dependent DNA helicase RecG